MKELNIAVVGATGLVGTTILEVLETTSLKIKSLKLLASARSVGKKLNFKGEELEVKETKNEEFTGMDLALFASTDAAASVFGPEATKQGCTVIDNGSTFRMQEGIPLVVPEVNMHTIKKEDKLIANPNCSTIQMVVALKPILDAVGLRKVIVSSYQSVSGWGKEAVEELTKQTNAKLNNQKIEITPGIFAHQIAFNCLPHIDKFTENGYTKEELKMINETRKILNVAALPITATCVRVPVYVGHSEAVVVETEKKISAKETRKLLAEAPGIIIIDNPEKNEYPLAINCEKKREVFVGRIREDSCFENGISLWIVADNLYKGAAANAVQIAEEMAKEGML